MSKTTKIIMRVLAIGGICFGFFVYFTLFGTPWGKVYHKYQLGKHLANKYNEELVLTKSIYSLKQGSYGVQAYVKDDPDIKFSAWQHYDKDIGYQDYFPEALWRQQVYLDFKTIIEELYPDAQNINFSGIMGISHEMDIKGEIPHYLETDHYFYLGITEEKKLTEKIKEQEINKIFSFMEVLKERDIYFDILITYYDKSDNTKNCEKYISLNLRENKKYLPREEIEKIFDEVL